jgi:hypothetical protein
MPQECLDDRASGFRANSELLGHGLRQFILRQLRQVRLLFAFPRGFLPTAHYLQQIANIKTLCQHCRWQCFFSSSAALAAPRQFSHH